MIWPLLCLGVPLLAAVALYATRAHWLAAAIRLPPARYRVRVTRDLAVPMTDGETLLANRYSPCAAGSFPTILIRSPWGRGGARAPLGQAAVFVARRFAERGYHVLVQETRRRPASRSQRPTNEGADGRATVAWIAAQPWFDGNLGWWGASYLGHIQWAAAAGAPAALKALMPITTSARWYDFYYHDGALALERVLSILYTTGRLATAPLRALPGLLRRQAEAVREASLHLPLGTVDEALLGAPDPGMREVIASDDPDAPIWRENDHRAALAQVEAPAHLIAGWFDVFLRQQLDDYGRLVAAGRGPQLTIGPWHHTDSELSGAAMREGLDWFEAHLKGRREGLRALPVKLLVMGANEWRSLPAWPPPSEPRRWHLSADGALVAGATASADAVRLHFDPADPTPTIGGALLGATAGMRDQRPAQARGDVRRFVSQALAEPIEVIGDVWLTLQVQTSAPWADVAARLCVVGDDGVARNLCDGLCRLTAERAGRQEDGGAQLRVRLGPTAYRFQRGERLQLQIAGGSHPLWARNLGTGEPDSTATQTRAHDYTIRISPDTPAILELPVTSDQAPTAVPGAAGMAS
ncbi:MAG TPA: CocE/NonD family hydrolase [Chloroflexaceae bacterium]|nr:CocE/NonD family hydrolase [Chloroflexaceae bacterium]